MSISMPYPAQAKDRQGLQPPTLHWAIVLVLSVFTFSLFGFFWAFRQALFVKKIDPTNPKSKLAVLEVGASFALALFSGLIGGFTAMTVARGGAVTDLSTVVNILHLFQWVCFTVASVLVRNSLVARYGVKMNLVLTWLFNIFYVQYHMTQIAKMQLPLIAAEDSSAPGMGQVMPNGY